jgi:hypothetical protein
MKKNIIVFLQYAIPLLLGIWLVRYLLSQVSFEKLIESFQKAEYGWVFLAWAMALAAHLSRAYRWKLLLQPLGYNPKLLNSFVAVMVGYFANFALPRLGEVTRCGVLKSTDDVPVNVGFGTVVAERVFDLVMLLLIMGFTFLLELNRLSDFFTKFLTDKLSGYQQILDKTWLILVIMAVLFAIMAVIVWSFREKILQNMLVKKIISFLKGIWEGIVSVRNLDKKWEFIFHTLFIWLMYYAMTYIVFFALPQTSSLGWRAGFVIFVVGSFGMAAPVQGGIGPFHILVSEALVFYGLDKEDGISLATFMHGTQIVLLFGAGAICAIFYWFFLRKPFAIASSEKNNLSTDS